MKSILYFMYITEYLEPKISTVLNYIQPFAYYWYSQSGIITYELLVEFSISISSNFQKILNKY